MLAICGNSYSYGTEDNTWPKILADKLKLPLLNMSACGAGNYFTCYQIEHVLKYNPKIDFFENIICIINLNLIIIFIIFYDNYIIYT